MSLSPAQEKFTQEVIRCLDHLRSQSRGFETVATRAFESLKSGGVLHVFGSGHSHSFAEEMFHRAGGLVPVNAWLEDYLMPHAGPKQVGPLERTSGLAPMILGKYSPQKGEVLIVISNSGINAVAVEAAQMARALGLFVVGVTSLTHSQGVPARNGGKKLYEVVDQVLDTGTPVGDAAVELGGGPKTAALSGVVGTLIAQLLTLGIAEKFAQAGLEIPVYQSANTPGGDERNKKLEARYETRIRHLR